MTTATLTYREYGQEEDAYYAAEVDTLRDLEVSLENYLGTQTEILFALRAFLTVNETGATIESFAVPDGATDRWDGLHALAWAPLVPRQDVRKFEQAVRNDRTSSVDTANFAVKSNGLRDELIIIRQVWPTHEKDSHWGQDLTNSSERRAAVERARTSRRPIATAALDHPDGGDDDREMMLIMPVFVEPVPGGPADGFAGVLLSVYVIDDLLNDAVGHAKASFRVFDIGSTLSDSVLPFTDSHPSPVTHAQPPIELTDTGPDASRLGTARYVEFADRSWQIHLIEPHPGHRSRQALYSIAFIGAIASAALGALAHATLETGRRARHQARSLTVGIRHANWELEKQKRRLREANDRLTKSNASLAEFNRIASHDLRSPLRGIRSLTNFARDDGGDSLSSDVIGHLDRIDERSDRMNELIDGMLEYSRTGHLANKVENVKIVDLVTGIFETLTIDDSIKLDIDSDVKALQLNITPFALCIRNILDNAIKHHPGPTGRISVNVRTKDSTVQVAIADDGAGIEERYLAKIFEPFFSLNPVSGSGMGLAVITKTAAMHGATIHAESAPGEGTTFVLQWPCADEEEQAEAPADASDPNASAGATDSEDSEGNEDSADPAGAPAETDSNVQTTQPIGERNRGLASTTR